MGRYNFVYDNDSHEDLKNKKFSDLQGLEYEANFSHLLENLIDLTSGSQRDKSDKRGYVLLINGSWGAGKSTATWSLINEWKQSIEGNQLQNELICIDKSFLPFGNTTESITSFLNELAYKLLELGVVDVRDEIAQFILEVTPEYEGQYRVSANFGPLSINKPFKVRNHYSQSDIKERFGKLAKKNKSVIIVLDDIDRLIGKEIVDVMRMVEKLRQLPRVIVILPVFKEIVTKAFQTVIDVSPNASPTFLRKLTDQEIKIENSLKDLKDIFVNTFQKNIPLELKDDEKKLIDDLTVSEICWYILLHNIVITEALEYIDADRTSIKLNDAISPASSWYISELKNLITKHEEIRRYSDIQPYPVHNRDEQGKEHFIPIGKLYSYLRNPEQNVDYAYNALKNMLDKDHVFRWVTTNTDIISQVIQNGQTGFDSQKEEASHKLALTEFFVRILRQSEEEPFVTTNYKLRDIAMLARNIAGNPRLDPDSESLLPNLYGVTQETFKAFR